MSWTAPRTWVTSEIVSASIMNTHVRDNLLETVPSKAASAGQQLFVTGANALAMVAKSPYKTADEIVNNSTTLQNDDHLAWAVAASEVWAFRFVGFLAIASGNPDFKSAFTVPAGSSGYRGALIATNTAAGFGSVADLTTALTLSPAAGTTFTTFIIHGVYIGGANAGTVQFQWAQFSAVASNMTLKLGSYIDLKRLA